MYVSCHGLWIVREDLAAREPKFTKLRVIAERMIGAD